MPFPSQPQYRGQLKFDDEDANFASGDYLASFYGSTNTRRNNMPTTYPNVSPDAVLAPSRYDRKKKAKQPEVASPNDSLAKARQRTSGLYNSGIAPDTIAGFERTRIENQFSLGRDKNIRDYSATIDRNTRQQQEQRYKTYADYQKDIYGINVKSGDTRYGIDTEDKTKRYLGIENIRSDERVGLTKIKTADETDRWKYQNVDATKKYQHDTVDATALAKAKVAASPQDYMSAETLSRQVNDRLRLFNAAKDQQYLDNQLKVAEFNAKYSKSNEDLLRPGVDKWNAQAAIAAQNRDKQAIYAQQRADEMQRYESQRRDAIAQRAQAMQLYQQQRQDKQQAAAEDRSRYYSEKQDYYGQRAQMQAERQQDRLESQRRYEQNRKDDLDQAAAMRSLQKEQFEFTKAKFAADLDLKRQDFIFRQQQYLDRRGDMNAANAIAVSARAAIGANYGTSYTPLLTSVRVAPSSGVSGLSGGSSYSSVTTKRNSGSLLSGSSR